MGKKPESKERQGRTGPAEKTRERLLDVAEVMFGERGFDAASVRDITDRAGANLGAVTYHFGSKEALFMEAFLRRARPVNERRLADLRALRQTTAATEPLQLRDILRCLLRGPLELARKHPEFVGLLTRTIMHPPRFALAALSREMEPLEGPFAVEMALALPHLPPKVLRLRVMLAGGSLHLLLNHWTPGREQSVLGPLPNLPVDQILDSLVEFCAAGLAAPLGANPQLTPPSGAASTPSRTHRS